MKVLIADDSKTIRDRLAGMIAEIEGAIVAGQAATSPDILRQVSEIKPDVVVLDIRMPGGSGIKALEKIKEILPGLLVIMLTNYSEPQYRRRCLEAGAEYFFDKSTEFEKVGEAIQCIIG